MTPLDLEAGVKGQICAVEKLEFVKDSQAMISCKIFSHFESLDKADIKPFWYNEPYLTLKM